MKKISQRELLSEGFWDDFVKPGARGAWQAAKEVANVVAPEITEPFKKLQNWKQGAKDRIDMEVDPKRALDHFLNDYSFHRIPNTGIQQLKKPTTDGDIMYTAIVSRLKINDEGQPEAELIPNNGRPYNGVFKNPKVIVKKTRDKQFKMVRSPSREMGTFKDDGEDDDNQTPPVNPQKITPPPAKQQSQTPP